MPDLTLSPADLARIYTALSWAEKHEEGREEAMQMHDVAARVLALGMAMEGRRPFCRVDFVRMSAACLAFSLSTKSPLRHLFAEVGRRVYLAETTATAVSVETMPGDLDVVEWLGLENFVDVPAPDPLAQPGRVWTEAELLAAVFA